MRTILSFLFLLSFVGVMQAQQPSEGLGEHTPSQVSRSDFRAQVQRELANYPHGEKLYRRCDVFERMVDHVVAARLHLGASFEEAAMSEQADTSYAQDISHTGSEEDETTIAISRKNPQLIVAGANDYAMDSLSMPAYVSTNSGNSWQTFRVPVVQDYGSFSWGDPIIIPDDSGNFYYAFLVVNPNDLYNSISDLMVARSSDGMNWTLGTPVLGKTQVDTALEDKETISIDRDPASPYHGRIYIAWTRYDDTGGETHFLAYSNDQAQTWSAPRAYTQKYGAFPLIRIGAKGTLFIASSTENDTDALSDNSNSHGMTVSTDGGETFSENLISNFTIFPPIPNGYPGLKGDNGFRAFPYVAYDVGYGNIEPTNNTIYAVYGSYDNNDGDAALFAVQSSDEGRSWSNALQIGTPALIGNDHFMPWVSHDAVTGETNISLYSSEEDPTLNIYSRAVQCTFSTTSQMKDIGYRLFNPLDDTAEGDDFIGDYAGNDAYAGCFAAAWTENRPPDHADGDIYAYVSSPFSSVSGATRQINAEEFDVSSSVPNPVAGNQITFTITSSVQLPAFIRIYDLRGNDVLNFAIDDESLHAECDHAGYSFPRGWSVSRGNILRSAIGSKEFRGFTMKLFFKSTLTC